MKEYYGLGLVLQNGARLLLLGEDIPTALYIGNAHALARYAAFARNRK
ncbi:MAG: hypothetical protein CM1200mP10_12480 [Candidatus Neomarinimicrobiota bacterium]|nr:MAG: hypothetical protein CM1200mP10_12480 [Candidatus Neomarinimicrobiota bacterium]